MSPPLSTGHFWTFHLIEGRKVLALNVCQYVISSVLILFMRVQCSSELVADSSWLFYIIGVTVRGWCLTPSLLCLWPASPSIMCQCATGVSKCHTQGATEIILCAGGTHLLLGRISDVRHPDQTIFPIIQLMLFPTLLLYIMSPMLQCVDM